MSVLVFGRTGQVGTALQRLADVTALGRETVSLTDPVACAAEIQSRAPSAVINAAAYTAVDRAEEEEARADLINGEAPGAMAVACAELGIPFVHISTDFVFSGGGRAPWRPEDPVGPLGAYGRSKLKGEMAVRAANGMQAVLRTSWVFSAHGQNFVKTMLRLAATRDHLTIVSDQIGGPTPAGAIARTCMAIARQLPDAPEKAGVYHYSGMPDVSWADFARAIFKAAGQPILVEDIPSSAWPSPARRPLNSRLDCATTETTFGIARPDWRMALTGIVDEIQSTGK